MALDPLASVDDLEARLGRALNDVEAVRAVPLLRDASAGARREAGRPFTAAAGETVRIRVRSTEVRLPGAPVTAVASIADVDGNELEFTWHGGDTARLSWIPAAGWVDVTYDHGYAEIPDDVIGAVCSAVLRTLGVSPLETGYQSENVEGYGYSVGSAAAAGAEDEFGNAEPAWAEPGVSYPARLTQVSGDEVTVGRDAQVSEWKLYLEADAVIEGRDRVRDDLDRVFEVVGPPLLARTPRGVHHVEARLRYLEG